MTKHCSVGINDFRTAIKHHLFFFVLLIFWMEPVQAQVPINGFCRITSVPLDGRYNKFVPVSFNEDPYTDLFLVNSKTGAVATFTGRENLQFEPAHRGVQSLHVTATSFHKMSLSNEMVFISDVQRKYGTITLGASGVPAFKVFNSLDYFPGQVSTLFDRHGKNSLVLLNGTGKQGISFFNPGELNGKLRSIIKSGLFPSLYPGDFNTDSYQDICAYDIRNDAISLFYNNSRNAFRFSKILPVKGNLNILTSYDLNSDGNPEIIYCTENTINILLGDSIHSYRSNKPLSTNKAVALLNFADFNRDGKIDIAYTLEGEYGVFVVFQKENFVFYPPVLYLEDKKIVDMLPFYSKFINALALLTDAGSMQFIHHVTTFAESLNISTNTTDAIPFFTDIGGDGIEDIGIIDNKHGMLKLFIRNKIGSPGLQYETPLFRPGNAVITLDKDKLNKSFYIFEQKTGKVQIINSNFHSMSSSRSELNLNGEILSYGQNTVNGQKIITCVIKNDYNIVRKQIAGDSVSSIRKLIAVSKTDSMAQVSVLKNGDILMVAINSDTIKWQLFPALKKEMQNIYRVINSKKNYLRTYCFDFLNNGQEQLLILMKNGKRIQSYLSYLNGRTLPVQYTNTFDDGFLPGAVSYFGSDGISGLNRFYLTTKDDKIYRADFFRAKKRILISPVPLKDRVSWFAVKKLNALNYSLIYTNKQQNYLGIEKL